MKVAREEQRPSQVPVTRPLQPPRLAQLPLSRGLYLSPLLAASTCAQSLGRPHGPQTAAACSAVLECLAACAGLAVAQGSERRTGLCSLLVCRLES